MALRNIRDDKDEILRKKSKEVDAIDNKIRELVVDMLETMYKNDGVGLAAPQVGVLKRILVYDIGDGPHVAINPVIVEEKGCQSGEEGCLSSPLVFGTVDRPEEVKVKYYDENGKIIKDKLKELEAIVFCHELDHLNGVLFLDKAYDVYTVTQEELDEAKKEAEKDSKKGKNKKNNKNNKNKGKSVKRK